MPATGGLFAHFLQTLFELLHFVGLFPAQEETGEGELLATIKEQTAKVASPQASAAVNRVAYFKVDEVRPLM